MTETVPMNASKEAAQAAVAQAYVLLGLPEPTPLEQVKERYLTLALKAHPQHVALGPLRERQEERFAAIGQAWEIIQTQGEYLDDVDFADAEDRFLEDLADWVETQGISEGAAAVRRVVDALVQRGCPPNLAQDLVEDMAQEYEGDQPIERLPQTPVLASGEALHQWPWEQAGIYYAAALRDGDRVAQFNEADYQRLVKVRRGWNWLWGGLAAAWGLVLLVGFVRGVRSDDTVPSTVFLLSLLWLLWLATRNRFMGEFKHAFLQEHRHRYYLGWFERLHRHQQTTSPGEHPRALPLFAGFNGAAALGGPLWLGYRRMHRLSWAMAALFGGVVVAAQLPGQARWASAWMPAWIVLALGLGLWANRGHFRQVQRRILQVLQQQPEGKALSILGEDRPVTPAGWIIPAVVLGALLSWASDLHETRKPLGLVQAPVAAEVASLGKAPTDRTA